MSNCRSTALSQSSASSGSLVWENVGRCPFTNSPCLSIGGAWCRLFNTLWAMVYNNWVCIIKACSIDGGFDGGGLELVGFLRSSCEALLLVATITEIIDASKWITRTYETSSCKFFILATPLTKRSTRGHKKGSLHLLLDERTSIKMFWHPNDTLVYGQEQEIWNSSWAENSSVVKQL